MYPSVPCFFCSLGLRKVFGKNHSCWCKTLVHALSQSYSVPLYEYTTIHLPILLTLVTETVQQIHTFQFFKSSAMVNVSVTQYLQHTDFDLNKRPLPGYTMTHIIKDCLPHQLWVMLFIFILSDQLWPAIKPYSFQPNRLANRLSQECTPWATSQRTDTLKRQARKQSEARKDQV